MFHPYLREILSTFLDVTYIIVVNFVWKEFKTFKLAGKKQLSVCTSLEN